MTRRRILPAEIKAESAPRKNGGWKYGNSSSDNPFLRSRVDKHWRQNGGRQKKDAAQPTRRNAWIIKEGYKLTKGAKILKNYSEAAQTMQKTKIFIHVELFADLTPLGYTSSTCILCFVAETSWVIVARFFSWFKSSTDIKTMSTTWRARVKIRPCKQFFLLCQGLTLYRQAMPFGNRKKYFWGSFQFSIISI